MPLADIDWVTLAWVLGGLLVGFWVLRRLFRSFRRLVLLLLLVLGAVWLAGAGGGFGEGLSRLGITSD